MFLAFNGLSETLDENDVRLIRGELVARCGRLHGMECLWLTNAGFVEAGATCRGRTQKKACTTRGANFLLDVPRTDMAKSRRCMSMR